MSDPSPLLVILASEQDAELANQLAVALGYQNANVVIGTPASGALFLSQNSLPIKYVVVDIGQRGADVMTEIDQLAEQCPEDVRVVVMGATNDIRFYRELINRGVLEYFVHPVTIAQLRDALAGAGDDIAVKAGNSKVITFMSAASGDGSSTLALNTAFCLARFYNKSTVLVDMDFQFGMIARNLDLHTPFGIKELLEHSERVVDETLINRMLVDYNNTFKIMAAPSDLRLWPSIQPEVIRDLIGTLRQKFDYVVIDLPHIWSSWLATALNGADYNVMVAQLWLRSVTHTSRLLGAWRDIGIAEDKIVTVINRSGAKFKEAVSRADYESVCRRKIDFGISNDIKTIVAAENEGKTIPEIGNSALAKEFRDFAGIFTGATKVGEQKPELNENSTKQGLSLASLFNKK